MSMRGSDTHYNNTYNHTNSNNNTSVSYLKRMRQEDHDSDSVAGLSKAGLLLEFPFSIRTLTGKVLTFIQRQIIGRILKPENDRDTDRISSGSLKEEIDNIDNVFGHLTPKHPALHGGSSLAGFLALLLATCVNYMLGPMRDAAALAVGVEYIPTLTLISTLLAIVSSVPIGWLFEAPDPNRRMQMLERFKLGFMTRGETQGTSLALFYRSFAIFLAFYAVGFKIIEMMDTPLPLQDHDESTRSFLNHIVTSARRYDKVGFSLFYLFIHLMKLHSISLIWGVASESMEFEEITECREKRRRAVEVANVMARKHNRMQRNNSQKEQHTNPVKHISSLQTNNEKSSSSRIRLEKLAFVGLGGTIGGIGGSIIASTASTFNLSGILFLCIIMLELSAELSIELGKIMKRHWKELQRINSSSDLTAITDSDGTCDTSMKRSSSFGSMKRISSGNSLHTQMKKAQSAGSLSNLENSSTDPQVNNGNAPMDDDSTFTARLLRGVTTILRSNLLMAIFTYNALFASTSVLLSFQRAELVANRKSSSLLKETSAASDTAFLAKINMISGMAVLFFQATGIGAFIAHKFGPRGSLSLMPFARLCGVLFLAWWHVTNDGKPPNLIHFLLIDEFTRVINFAVAKPVREGLWRGLSNEARYEAKPIVDTLANRWGGGSAAFLVSTTDRIQRLFGNESTSGHPSTILGFPPVMLLCLIISAWWAVVSTHVGHIRSKIDSELKKHQ